MKDLTKDDLYALRDILDNKEYCYGDQLTITKFTEYFETPLYFLQGTNEICQEYKFGEKIKGIQKIENWKNKTDVYTWTPLIGIKKLLKNIILYEAYVIITQEKYKQLTQALS